MTEPSSKLLKNLVAAAAILTGAESKINQAPNMAAVLKSRLVQTYQILGEGHDDTDNGDLDELQYTTAKASMYLVERVQSILDPVGSTSEHTPPPLGARDLSHIRTLISIVFKWAVKPLLTELELYRPGPTTESTSGEHQIIDLTKRNLHFEELPPLISRILNLIFELGPPGKTRQTWITTSIVNQHTIDLLTPSIILGWSSISISDSFTRAGKDIKDLSIRFMNLLRPDQAITALGAILTYAGTNRPFTHVPKVCARLLTNQLKRPNAIRGLCTAVLGNDTDDAAVAPLDKLEQIAKLLRTVPSTSKPEAYYQFMIPRILELLLPEFSDQTPPSHKRAAAFALSRMISPTFQHGGIASSVLRPLLHDSFLYSGQTNNEVVSSLRTMPAWRLTPADALKLLQSFLLHMDPSPAEVSILLTPIIPELYTLLSLHRTSKILDPTVRESLGALMNSWGRIVSSSDVTDCLCGIINGAGGEWELGLEGFTRSAKSTTPSISLLTVTELECGSKDDVDINANPFNLRPDPSMFVGFLKSLDRQDVTSAVFVRLLNAYRELKDADSDPMRTLLHLQLILQVQSQLSTTILSMPEHVFSFVKYVLTSEPQHAPIQQQKTTQKKGLGLKDLQIITEQESSGGDSDDEENDGQAEQSIEGGGRDEMVITAITLLLSILEGDSNNSQSTISDLSEILAALENLILHPSPAIRQISREARLVLTARTASTYSTHASSATRHTEDIESAQATYQKALKLLQDPIIPVRAHGLQLLRDLVSRPSASHAKAGKMGRKAPLLDPALVPGILSIFLQSIQDDESYLFLNAVQGLAAMVDGYGKDVLRGVVDVYLSGTGIEGFGSSGGVVAMSKEELNARIRVGEALNITVRRCGGTLGAYTDLLIPPLLTILRSSHLPTVLRTSALAILAQCIATYAPALIAYTPKLVDACVELIQLESVVAKGSIETRGKQDVKSSPGNNTGGEEDTKSPLRLPEPTDTDPVTKDTKVAPFRRSALHFLSQLLRSHTEIVYNSRPTYPAVPEIIMTSNFRNERQDFAIPELALRRIGVVLDYVAATDEDAVTRVMAREASEFVDQYRKASLGL